MSPVGGVGINLAIQDAVAAANILAPHLRRGRAPDRALERVQTRRLFPTKATQALQVAIQERVLQPALANHGPLHVSAALRLLDRVPLLQRVPAYVLGVGFRPEHVRTAFDERQVSRWAAA
jgi:2-polyprenyl-6-methoxyphenol hydroxylase-like FAD-dependent oxidoreductase